MTGATLVSRYFWQFDIVAQELPSVFVVTLDWDYKLMSVEKMNNAEPFVATEWVNTRG